MVRAAVLPAVGAPLEITEIELPEPGPGQVRVRLAAAGVCHSDLSLSNGTMRVARARRARPRGRGHGRRRRRGRHRRRARATASSSTGRPPAGVPLLRASASPGCAPNALTGAATVPYARTPTATSSTPGSSVAAFAEETVVAANVRAARCRTACPLTDAALLGCAVLTGYGAVHHSARVRDGRVRRRLRRRRGRPRRRSSPRGSPAPGPIVAVDVSPEKEELARAAGATEYVVASDDHRQARSARSPAGTARTSPIECVGRAETIRTAWDSTRRGGRTTVVGIGGKDEQVQLPPWRSSTSPARSPAASTATATPPGICRCWPSTSGRGGWTWAPWSPNGSGWTGSRPPSTPCWPDAGGAPWWCSTAEKAEACPPGRAGTPRRVRPAVSPSTRSPTAVRRPS